MNAFTQFVQEALTEKVAVSKPPAKTKNPYKLTTCPGVYLHSSNRARGEPYYIVRVYADEGAKKVLYDGPDFFEACCAKKSVPDKRFKKSNLEG